MGGVVGANWLGQISSILLSEAVSENARTALRLGLFLGREGQMQCYSFLSNSVWLSELSNLPWSITYLPIWSATSGRSPFSPTISLFTSSQDICRYRATCTWISHFYSLYCPGIIHFPCFYSNSREPFFTLQLRRRSSHLQNMPHNPWEDKTWEKQK